MIKADSSSLPQRWRKYPKYKESGIEWLGEVPDEWDIGRLKFYCSVNPSKSEIGFLPDDLEVSFLPMENLGEDHSLCLNLIKPLSEVWNGYTYFKENDVILAKITPCFENGKCSVCSGLKNKIGFGTTELHVLRALNSIIPRFCYYIVQNHAFKSIGTELMFGTTGQKRLPDSYVKDYKQGIPPLPEQHAIAAFLDRETARIDALIEKKERQIELLQEKRAALISHVVTKGLDPNVKMKDSGIEWLGMVPEGWEILKIGRVKSKKKYAISMGPFGSDIKVDNFIEMGIPLIQGSNLISYFINEENFVFISENKADELIFANAYPKDIVITHRGTIGQVSLIPENSKYARYVVSQSQMKVTFNDEIIFSNFVNYFLNSIPGQIALLLNKAQTAIPAIGQPVTSLKSIQIVVPPLSEQKIISALLKP